MATTVRIQGSRAREQVPGTGITLHAPGFGGSLTQLTPGDASDVGGDLPFAEAAQGADVMLAGQFFMTMAPHPPGDGPELRSLSAVAAHPRLIVPRRRGVAYGLLQTDADGESRFVWPHAGADDEAVFPLHDARAGEVRRTLRVFMWPAAPVQGPGTSLVISGWERQHRRHRLLELSQDGEWRILEAEAPRRARGAALLLLHDTFATPASFDDWIGDVSFAALRTRYPGGVFAFAHPTLASSIDENLQFLRALPDVERLDLVGHGRGGLLVRAIAARDLWAVRRAVLLGTPNRGTPRAAPGNGMRFLDGHIARLATLPHAQSLPILEGALSLARCVALGLPLDLAGFEALAPGSSFVESLGRAPASTEWFSISARFGSLDEAPRPDESPDDLLVPADSCHLPTTELTDGLWLEGPLVHHHSYFASPLVRERLLSWLI